MASTIVEIQLATGTSSPTLELYPLGSTTLANSPADTLTQETNADGFWRATVTEALSGVYRAVAVSGGSGVASGYVYLADDTNTYRVESSYALASASVSGSDIQAACNAALVANHLDHFFAAEYDPGSKPGVATALMNEIVQEDSGTGGIQFTTEALELAPSSDTVEQVINVNETTVNS